MGKNIAKNYTSVLNTLKCSIKEARNRSLLTVNTQMLQLYWQIGAVILAQRKNEGWGAKVVARLAIDLKREFPDMNGLSQRNLVYMQTFAAAYPHFSITQVPLAQMGKISKKSKNAIAQVPLAQLPWYHHITLLDKVKQIDARIFYIQKSIENGWSRNVLVHQIESKLHLRQGKTINNFKSTIPAAQNDLINETFKSPYLLDFLSLGEKLREVDLEKAMLNNVKKLVLEMGKGFAFVGNQYHIKVGETDRVLDLLFYNFHLYRFVVVEIKIGEFLPEYAGKLNFYINAVDELVKGKGDKATIGLLLCRAPDHTCVKFALHGIKSPIGVSDYKLMEELPKEFKAEFPSVQQIEEGLATEVKAPLSKRKKIKVKKLVRKRLNSRK